MREELWVFCAWVCGDDEMGEKRIVVVDARMAMSISFLIYLNCRRIRHIVHTIMMKEKYRRFA